MNEQAVPWAPLPNLRGEFSLVTLLDDEEGLHLVFENDTGRTLRVDFRSSLAYRLTGRAVIVKDTGNQALESVYSGNEGAFFLLENSSWSTPCNEAQSYHHLFVLAGEIIEVLTDETPNVSWENSLFGDAV